MRARGLTLLELVISLALISVLSAVCATLLLAARRDDALARGYAADLRAVCAASDLVAAELRTAHEVVLGEGGVTVDGRAWTVVDDSLLCDGERRVSGVGRVDVVPVGERTFRVAVAPRARREGAHVPTLDVTVRCRPEASR